MGKLDRLRFQSPIPVVSTVRHKGVIDNVKGPEEFTLTEDFTVKDSGVREEYENGFIRDTEEGKADYARILTIEGLELIPVEMLERLAAHMVKGAAKYGIDNWRQARGMVPKLRFGRSLCRHVRQLLRGERDEDHMSAVIFNAFAHEFTPELNYPCKFRSEWSHSAPCECTS